MRVAAVQAAPAFLDRDATTKIVLSRLEEAAAAGAELVAFPETFLPGYPQWVYLSGIADWFDPLMDQAFGAYLDAAVDVSRGDLDEIVAAAADLEVFVYLGVAERSPSGGSVYCSLVAIDPQRGIVSVHRKLKPTFVERLAWADGDGAGLVVHDHRGVRLSGLSCWENRMPLARAAMWAQGPDVHVSTWPGTLDFHRDENRFVAQEGRVYVVAAGGVLGAEHVPDDFPLRERMIDEWGPSWESWTGVAMVVSPTGEVLAEAAPNEEVVLVADIDPAVVRAEHAKWDPAGHYSRPDVLRLSVDRTRRHGAEFHDPPPA